jgi:hypothetical protein
MLTVAKLIRSKVRDGGISIQLLSFWTPLSLFIVLETFRRLDSASILRLICLFSSAQSIELKQTRHKPSADVKTEI